MGTTSRRRAPKSNAWKSVVADICDGAEKAAPIVDSTIKIVLPTLPNGPAKIPIYYAGTEGLRFCYDAYKYGIEEAVKKEGINLTRQFVAPQISDAIWSKVTEKAPSLANSPMGVYAERAFKRTMNEIIVRGVEAGIDRL